jgi:hypothetical protein
MCTTNTLADKCRTQKESNFQKLAYAITACLHAHPACKPAPEKKKFGLQLERELTFPTYSPNREM